MAKKARDSPSVTLKAVLANATFNPFALAIEGVHPSGQVWVGGTSLLPSAFAFCLDRVTGGRMSPVEQLFVTSMLAWTLFAQASLWRLTRNASRLPMARTVPVPWHPSAAGRRSSGRDGAPNG